MSPSSGTPSTPPPKVATQGGMVAGLAETDPPTAFVAELGDPARAAASSVTDPLMMAAGRAQPTPPRVRIGGTELATRSTPATALGSVPAQAQTIGGSSVMRIAGDAVACEGDAAALGGARMVLGAGPQQSLRLGGGSGAIEPPTAPTAAPGADSLAALRKQIPVRTQWGEPPPQLQMLSRCSPARRRDLVPSQLAVLVGDPVDVATGAVVSEAVELHTVSPPLRLSRRYASNHSDRLGALGWGWSHGFEAALWLEPGRVVLREADGRELEFDTMTLPGQVARAGDVLHDSTGRLRLRALGRLHWELTSHDDDGPLVRHFRPETGESAAERDRGMSRLARVVRPRAVVIECVYDERARLHELRIDTRRVLAFEYDDAGRLESLWTPQEGRLQRHARFEYGADGDLVAAFDEHGLARRYEYVGHLLVAETDRDGARFFYGYDGHGARARCIRSWGGGGELDRCLAYDRGRTEVTDSLGNVSTYGVDACGAVAEIIDPHGDAIRYRHDAQLRLVEVAFADGNRIVDAYDDAGRLVKRRLQDGASWRMAYDEAGRLVQGWDPTGARWSFGYDAVDALVSVEDPLGHRVRLEYDAGRLARIVDPLGQCTEVVVDALGNVVELVPPAGTGPGGLRFEYDACGRLAAMRSAGDVRVACISDAHGRVISQDTAVGPVRLARSAEGELVGIDAPTGRWGIARDALGNVRAVHGPDLAVAYDHDSEGRLVAVRREGLPALSLLRDARGLVTAFTRDADAPTLIQHGANGRRIERIVGPDHAPLQLSWDPVGRLLEVERSGAGETTRARFDHRADGLLVAATNHHARLVIERDARGAVLRQRLTTATGEAVVESAALDFRGRRQGLDVDPLRVSYLRSAEGEVERVAIVHDRVWDIAVTRSEDRRTEWLRAEFGVLELAFDDFGALRAVVRIGADGRMRSWQPGQGPTRRDGASPHDALGRALGDGAETSAVFDEDRCVRQGPTWWLHHPDRGLPIAAIIRGRMEFVLPGDLDADGGTIRDGAAARHAACFPLLGLPALQPSLTAPAQWLARWFRHRTWAPTSAPGGDPHWCPDDWTAEPTDARAADGRVDAPRLRAILAVAFPTTCLRPISFDQESRP
ncbi:MAG: RHS repeat protein [Deltaproteobacteria bacterium]|nr:RHS repeat protein [Deltaproteobacteria bacterium]